MATEQTGRYIGITSVECRGANLSSRLPRPINVTVALKADGSRKVGCPYLKGLEHTTLREEIYVCTARQSPQQSTSLSNQVDQFVEGLESLSPHNDEAKKQWADFKTAVTRIAPICFHKEV